MILKMTDRVMVILTNLGMKIYKKKAPELEKVYGRTGLPKVVVHDGKSVMRSTMRMLFAMFGDHMTTKERHKRVFVDDILLFEELPEAQRQEATEPDVRPKLDVFPTPRRSRVIRPTTLTIKEVSEHTEAMKRASEKALADRTDPPIIYNDTVAENKTEDDDRG